MADLKAVNSEQLDALVESIRIQVERAGEFPMDWRTGFNEIVEHTPEDLTVTVQAGLSLGGLQSRLRVAGQWLPIDPLDSDLSIGELIEGNHFGPRRHAHGTIRDHLIGLAVVTGEGKLARNGGKVVKNVAGYDLLKLFTGSRGSLGRVVEATFKLLPLPEVFTALEREVSTADAAAELRAHFHTAHFQPAWMDLVMIPGSRPVFSMGFEGAGEEVEEQVQRALAHGLVVSPRPMMWERRFHDACPRPIWRSHLPSKLPSALSPLGEGPFLALLGCGLVATAPSVACPPVSQTSPAEMAIANRLKAMFDPKGILPPLPYERC